MNNGNVPVWDTKHNYSVKTSKDIKKEYKRNRMQLNIFYKTIRYTFLLPENKPLSKWQNVYNLNYSWNVYILKIF